MSLLRENMHISYFSPNFFFKIIFLQDEKIFFILICFSVLVCTSSIQKIHLEHPQCLQSDAKQRIVICISKKSNLSTLLPNSVFLLFPALNTIQIGQNVENYTPEGLSLLSDGARHLKKNVSTQKFMLLALVMFLKCFEQVNSVKKYRS